MFWVSPDAFVGSPPTTWILRLRLGRRGCAKSGAAMSGDDYSMLSTERLIELFAEAA